MMKQQSWGVALGLMLAALLTTGCGDSSRIVGPDVGGSMNTGMSAEAGGAEAGESDTEPEETTFTASDTTGRGPGGTIGSGH